MTFRGLFPGFPEDFLLRIQLPESYVASARASEKNCLFRRAVAKLLQLPPTGLLNGTNVEEKPDSGKSSEIRLFGRYFEFFDSFVTFVEKNSKPPTSHALNSEDPKPGSPRIPIIIHSIIMFLLCPQHRDLLPACRKSYAFPMNQALLNALMRRRCRRSCCTWC